MTSPADELRRQIDYNTTNMGELGRYIRVEYVHNILDNFTIVSDNTEAAIQNTTIQRWAETDLHNDIRDLQARCTFLYGLARAKGATVEELAGGWTVTGANIPIEHTQTIQCHCGIHPYIITDYDERPITRYICPDHGLVTGPYPVHPTTRESKNG